MGALDVHPFAVMGAFETFPAIPTDMSEQVAFGMIKRFDQERLDLFAKREGKKKITAGARLNRYDQLMIYGVPDERRAPHTRAPNLGARGTENRRCST